jgi:hypothetical protein
VPYLSDTGSRIYPGFLHFKSERPFLLLDSVVIPDTGYGSDSNFDQGLQNDLVFLADHPIVHVIQVAEVSDFHVSPGSYTVPDERSNEATQTQYVFLLICTNFT